MKTKLTLKKRVSLYFSLFLLAGFAGLQDMAEAQVGMPEYDRLSPLESMISGPTDVAIDQQGRAYITETTRGRVTILTQSGNYSGKMLTGVDKPISVAVDSIGRIFVGGRDNGSVSVYGSDLGFLFYLGGQGIFGKPMDIAIDSSDNIYVVDMIEDSIRIFDSNGTETGAIDSRGNGDGQLHHPISIAIDENVEGGELIVLDK